jgi:hypothetical protein
MDNARFIGLSLSGCIMDIAKGLIDEQDVKCIVAGTCWPLDDVDHLLNQYKKLEWISCYEMAKEILLRFIKQGKIIQPRLLGLPYLNIAYGRWAFQGHLEDLKKGKF